MKFKEKNECFNIEFDFMYAIIRIMKYIKKMTDEDFGLESIPFKNNTRHRFGARGIIFNAENKIAILHKREKNEFKLIGGGIEKNENPIKAFKREAHEETGCTIDIDKFLGIFEELKSQDNFKQTSYIYVGHIVDFSNQLHLTKKEKREGAQILWCSINEAMHQIKNCENNLLPSKFESNMSVYHTKFIVRRDYEILKYYKNHYIDK